MFGWFPDLEDRLVLLRPVPIDGLYFCSVAIDCLVFVRFLVALEFHHRQ